MTRTMMFLSTAVAGSLLAFLPTAASAQSWGSYGDGYRHYGYNDGYRDSGRDHWRDRRDRRDRWEARRRWEREREWRREHRRHHRDWRYDDYRY